MKVPLYFFVPRRRHTLPGRFYISMAAFLPRSDEAVSHTAAIRELVRKGETNEACVALSAMIAKLFDLDVLDLVINADLYSLNSLNGSFRAETEKYVFKFHQEEGEEAMAGEYYRAGLLADAGLPVDMPVYVSALPGEQILLYRYRSDQRFADILRDLEYDDNQVEHGKAVQAEMDLNRRLLDIYCRDLHSITAAQSVAEPIHQLFHARLVTRTKNSFPGGRYKEYYVGQAVSLAGVTLGWDNFATRKFVINGIRYRDTIDELFTAAQARLAPHALSDAGGVVAHGDAHNANIWYHRVAGNVELQLFDPAFAGAHVPSLLAEIKATFHNILAHPFWLYDPVTAAGRFSADVTVSGNEICIDTDWKLSAIRQDLLTAKAEYFWRPWLATLAQHGFLSSDWRHVIRLSLFLCPVLVMNLRAGATRHNQVSSTIGFACAMMVGSEPEGEDFISRFLDMIDPRLYQ
ncbi:MAG: hypothetical protein POH28_02690 [Acidocella sp.]|nr:hypothetical protein [Acidocella sp.]